MSLRGDNRAKLDLCLPLKRLNYFSNYIFFENKILFLFQILISLKNLASFLSGILIVLLKPISQKVELFTIIAFY